MTTVITGASKGIGLELAKQLIAMKKNVISCARSDGFTFLDLERQSSIYALRDELLDTPINLLVCNAGVFFTFFFGLRIELHNWLIVGILSFFNTKEGT